MAPFPGYKPVHETFPRKIVGVHWPSEFFTKSVIWRFLLNVVGTSIPGTDSCRPVEAPFITNAYLQSSKLHVFYTLAANQPEVDFGLTVTGTITTPDFEVADGVTILSGAGSSRGTTATVPYPFVMYLTGPLRCYGVDSPFGGFSSMYGRPVGPDFGAPLTGEVNASGPTATFNNKPAPRIGTNISWGGAGINVVIGFRVR